MDRRIFLAGAAILGLQSLASSYAEGWAGLPARVASDGRAIRRGGFRRVRPSDPGWPSAAAWNKLNTEVGGSLIKGAPLLDACSREVESAACKDALQNLHNPFYIGDQPQGTQVSGWVDAWEPAASAFVVAARNSSDVRAAVNFARENNLRLAVKGGGHSYQGTSNAPDSLLIWTRSMYGISLHDSFVPQGCGGTVHAQPAVTLDAGAMWIDAYDAVTTKAGRYVQGGGCATVGVPGLIQSGGFGSFSKGFGTASASLLEAQIVTADGALRTVNPCRDADLYWALKGGGGGSWGVVTQVTLRTHDLPEFFGGAQGTVRARTDQAFRELIKEVITFYRDRLFNPHWGEQISIGPDNTLRISMVCQGLDKSAVEPIWRPLFDHFESNSDLTVMSELWAGAVPARHWWDAVERKHRGSDSMIGDPRPSAPAAHAWWRGDQEQVGAVLYAYESAWLPAALLEHDQRDRLINSLFAASRHHTVGLHFNKGLAGAPREHIAAAAETAMNPQALSAFALAIIADGGAPAYPGRPGAKPDAPAARQSRRDVSEAMRELKRAAPDAGSYVSESNFFEPAWQRSFWGDEHHARLRAVKSKYDPEGLFFVHHGVGSEAWSADGFVRSGQTALSFLENSRTYGL